MASSFLRSALAQESRAYGFTIAFWGSGMVLVGNFGTPVLNEILLYAIGAIAGFGALTLFTFRRPLENAEYEETDFMVFSTMHFISSLIPILVASWLAGALSETAAFFLSGVSVSANYNILMLVEERLAEKVAELERKIAS